VRILVTGISGQVGAAIMRRFDGLGTLIGADRAALDLSRPREIAERLDTLKPDLILNPAAYTAVDRAEDERELAFTINAQAPGAIAQWAAPRGVPLVHFSTDYVFDGSGEKPWREDDTPAPLNAYGATKLAGEEAIRGAGGAHLIVRTSWVYAAAGNNFLRTIARLSRERDELRIVADQTGSPTSAAWIADAVFDIVRAGDLPAAFARTNGLVHAAAAGQTTWHGFASAIVAGLKARGVTVKTNHVVPITSADYPTKAARPRNSRLDLTRLSDVFGVTPPPWTRLLEIELDGLAATLR
jgi:dTDP-4-dehydrorhamnose reductase